MIGIYQIENLINNKKYIGQSINIKERWNEHKRINSTNTKTKYYPLYRAFDKYGIENFSFTIIEECTKDKLNEREKFWINKLNTYFFDNNSNGYNLTRGGDGHQQISEQEIELIINLWKEGKTTGEICDIIKKEKRCIINYLKVYCDDYNIQESNRRAQIISGIKHRKKINQYDLLGNFIASYDSIKIAAQNLQYAESCILKNLKYKTKTCHSYYFIYDEENQEEGLKKHMKQIGNSRPVIQKDLNDNILNTYESASAAGRSLGKSGNSIIACCLGKLKTAYKYKWEYL